jgi:hypothetical protein
MYQVLQIQDYKQTKSEALVRERTILIERPPLVGEVSANFYADRRCRVVSAADPRRPYSGFSRPEPVPFLPCSSSMVLTRLSVSCSRPNYVSDTFEINVYSLIDMPVCCSGVSDSELILKNDSLKHLIRLSGRVISPASTYMLQHDIKKERSTSVT